MGPVVGAAGMPGPGGQPLELRLHETYGLDVAELQRVIEGTVAPETWGPAPHQGALFHVGKCLLIRQTPAVQADVQELIRELNIGSFQNLGGFF
jgi:hypothetical protein